MISIVDNTPLTAEELVHPEATRPDGLPAAFSIGEDGDQWIVIGHVPGPVAVDAIEYAADDIWGIDLQDAVFGLDRDELAEALEKTWGRFTTHRDDCHRVTGIDPGDLWDDDVNSCSCDYEATWWVNWHEIDQDTPGAIPILVWRA